VGCAHESTVKTAGELTSSPDLVTTKQESQRICPAAHSLMPPRRSFASPPLTGKPPYPPLTRSEQLVCSSMPTFLPSNRAFQRCSDAMVLFYHSAIMPCNSERKDAWCAASVASVAGMTKPAPGHECCKVV
jgi:hypothetical protein